MPTRSQSFIKELNSFDDEHLDALAIRNDYRNYSYRQMFRRWDKYAEVFSALGMTDENSSCVGMLPGFSTEAIFSFYALNMTGAIVSIVLRGFSKNWIFGFFNRLSTY